LGGRDRRATLAGLSQKWWFSATGSHSTPDHHAATIGLAPKQYDATFQQKW
jgi:hypothetical protein